METRHVVAVVSVAALCLVGCTPTATGSPTPPPSTPPITAPTPAVSPIPTTPAWSAEQQSAIDAVVAYYEVYSGVMRMERDPNDLYLVAREDAADQAGTSYNQLLGAGIKADGTLLPLSTVPGAAAKDGERVAVAVEVCEDGREWRLLDGDGNDVLNLDEKKVLPVVATVELWPSDGWFVTQFKAGDQRCVS